MLGRLELMVVSVPISQNQTGIKSKFWNWNWNWVLFSFFWEEKKFKLEQILQVFLKNWNQKFWPKKKKKKIKKKKEESIYNQGLTRC